MRVRVALWIGVACLVVLGLLPHEQREDRAWRAKATTFSAGPSGAKALYLLLDRMGLEVERLRRPAYEQLSPDQVLWVLAPEPFGRSERRALLRFVENGGTVVGVPEALAPLFEAAKLCDPCTLTSARTPDVTLVREGVTLDLGEPPRRLEGLSAPKTVHVIANDDSPAVASYEVGRGQIVTLGIGRLAHNNHIGAANNGRFLARLALDLGPRHVFDEFKAGFGDGDLASLLERVPYRWALAQLGLAGLAWLFGVGPRRWPAQPVALVKRRRTLDHVEAVAHFWRRAGDAGLPLSALLKALDDRARLRGSDGPTPFLSRVLRARPELSEHARASWARAEALAQGPQPRPEDARAAAATLLALDPEGTKR
jgi:hypothetical protein